MYVFTHIFAFLSFIISQRSRQLFKTQILIIEKSIRMANRALQILVSVGQNIDDDLEGFTPLKKICDQYKIKPSHIFVPVVLLVIFSTFIGLCEHIFVTLFGFLYPAYMSFKAINKNSEQESKQWLTYWIVFGFLTSFDGMLSIVLRFLPAYYTFKVLFYIWLFYPRTNGAHILYEKLFRPQLKKLKALAEKYHPQ